MYTYGASSDSASSELESLEVQSLIPNVAFENQCKEQKKLKIGIQKEKVRYVRKTIFSTVNLTKDKQTPNATLPTQSSL